MAETNAWHQNLVRELVAETPAGRVPDAAAALEVAFGEARSAVAYALEVARAHRIAVAGSVNGDDVWLALGEGRVRFTLNRRDGHVIVNRPDVAEVRVPSDGDVGGAAGADGKSVAQLGAMAREAIDALIARWRALPPHAKRPSAPPADFEDEPTKG
jgi:hypothetical protein